MVTLTEQMRDFSNKLEIMNEDAIAQVYRPGSILPLDKISSTQGVELYKGILDEIRSFFQHVDNQFLNYMKANKMTYQNSIVQAHSHIQELIKVFQEKISKNVKEDANLDKFKQSYAAMAKYCQEAAQIVKAKKYEKLANVLTVLAKKLSVSAGDVMLSSRRAA